MRFPLSAALLAAVVAAPAAAEGPKTYAFGAGANYCPNGLQPITMNGVICCGQPNQSQSYQQVMRHPVAKPRHVRRARTVDTCAEGVKGCY
ncbi:hypothetical protein [Roseovarius sp. MMSF_3281]|uniref:hypothetical protein n=1 Tax=Roseovarius sp. MMSF_3281 TaxID=3046694 RepID=UPI00273ECDAC|nr:hypothetical protein [Roseovarius sp. MMSF_3281]